MNNNDGKNKIIKTHQSKKQKYGIKKTDEIEHS